MKISLVENRDDVYDVYKRISNIEKLNVFQSRFYYDTLLSGKQTFPSVIIAEDENLIKGFVLIQTQNYFSPLLKAFSSRAVISGGPIFNDDEDVLSAILSEYNRIFKSKVVYTQIRNLYDVDNYNRIFEENKFSRIGHLNYLIDLNNSIDAIWDNVNSKRKNEIRKGIKEGITVREISYASELSQAYLVLELIYKKAKLPLPEYDYFYNARNIADGDKIFRVLGGYYENNLIGVMFLLCFNGRVYNWYAASNPDYYKKYPNDVITWEAIKWASENGFKIFDFGGAGNPSKEYGVREYKKKYGGEEVNLGRYECIHKPLVMKTSEYGFKLWQKFK
jgi:serine/alanine adding enzyme